MNYMKDADGNRIDSWLPTRDVRNVIAWWDAPTALAGLTDGTAVRTLSDRSGLKHDLVQATPAAQPTKATANGKPVLNFATGQSIGSTYLGTWPVGGGFTNPVAFIAVVKASSTNTGFPAALHCADRRIVFDAGLTGSAFLYGTTSSTPSTGPIICDDAWHIIVGVYDTASAWISVDGYVQWGSTTALATPALTTATLGSSFLGQIGEVMILNKRVTLAEGAQITKLLASKWGITLPVAPAMDASANWTATTSSNGQSIRIFDPAVPAANPPIVLFAHQYGQTDAFNVGSWPYNLAHACTANGWPFAASNMHGNQWGSTTALADLADLATTMKARYPNNSGVILVGASMGGAAVANALAKSSITGVLGAYFIDAVFSLLSMYETTGYTASIDTAYGAANGTLSAATTVSATSIQSSVSLNSGWKIVIDPLGTNPEVVTVSGAPTGSGPYTIPVPALQYAHASGVGVSAAPQAYAAYDPIQQTAASFPAIRYRFRAGATDTTVSKAKNTDVFQPIIATRGIEYASVGRPGGTHLVGSSVHPGDLAAFIKRCIGTA